MLVTSIPPDWLNVEALDRLYDVFPGGVRNIWINRNFDDLNEKVKERNKMALKLEGAETDLIAQCKKAQLKKAKAEAKKEGKSKASAEKQEKKAADKRASHMAMGPGISSGNPHDAHTVREALDGTNQEPPAKKSEDGARRVFDPAFAAAGAVGLGVGKLGKTVLGGFRKVEHGFDGPLTQTRGFVATTDDVLPLEETRRVMIGPLLVKWLQPKLLSLPVCREPTCQPKTRKHPLPKHHRQNHHFGDECYPTRNR